MVALPYRAPAIFVKTFRPQAREPLGLRDFLVKQKKSLHCSTRRAVKLAAVASDDV